MDLYTMNESFIADEVVDDFISAIWTERYSSSGDVTIVTAASAQNIEILKEGTFLGKRGSKEVMHLQTQSIEDNQLKVLGKTLDEALLNERLAWFKNPDTATDQDDPIVDRTVTGKVGQLIADVVEDMVITPVDYTGDPASANLEWAFEVVPGLELGDVDISGDDERLTFVVGPLYNSIQQIAEKHKVGISLYLHEADIDAGFTLRFKTYRGVDRTSDQSTYPLVRLLPAMESISDLKEIRSIASYKNVVYVLYQGEVSVHYEDPLNIPEGFARRVMATDAEGEPVGRKTTYTSPWQVGGGTYTQYVVGPAEVEAFREQHAKDALANYNYIRSVDGQTSPDNDYKFGVDYFLGDIIELQGLTGVVGKARVTEHIHAQDKTGEREYPTIAVVS